MTQIERKELLRTLLLSAASILKLHAQVARDLPSKGPAVQAEMCAMEIERAATLLVEASYRLE